MDGAFEKGRRICKKKFSYLSVEQQQQVFGTIS